MYFGIGACTENVHEKQYTFSNTNASIFLIYRTPDLNSGET